MWIRSYFARDEFSWWSGAQETSRSTWTERSLSFGRGQLRFDYRSALETGGWIIASGVEPGFRRESSEPMPTYSHIDGPPAGFEWGGFVFDYHHEIKPNSRHDGESRWLGILVVMPVWFATSVYTIATLLPLIGAFLRRRRFRPGHCVICGYDLRETPERCPECGNATRRKGA
jgi:hypothetical protein